MIPQKIIREINKISRVVEDKLNSLIRDKLQDNVILRKKVSYALDDIGVKVRPYLFLKGTHNLTISQY